MIGLRIVCFRCSRVLTDAGALVFSPPGGGMCQKFHVCQRCWKRLNLWLNTPPKIRKKLWGVRFSPQGPGLRSEWFWTNLRGTEEQMRDDADRMNLSRLPESEFRFYEASPFP